MKLFKVYFRERIQDNFVVTYTFMEADSVDHLLEKTKSYKLVPIKIVEMQGA